MARHYNFTPSRFFCTNCGKEGIPVQRKRGQERESGHLKKLYCMFCGEEHNHVEVREIDSDCRIEEFKEEFEMGRFVDGKKISINELFSCSCESCPFNKDSKCWNANNSTNCPHKPKEV